MIIRRAFGLALLAWSACACESPGEPADGGGSERDGGSPAFDAPSTDGPGPRPDAASPMIDGLWTEEDYDTPTRTTPCGGGTWCIAPQICIDGACVDCLRAGTLLPPGPKPVAGRNGRCCSGLASYDRASDEARCLPGTALCRGQDDCTNTRCIEGVCRYAPPGGPCGEDYYCAVGSCSFGRCPTCLSIGEPASGDIVCCADRVPGCTSCVGRGSRETSCRAGAQCASGICDVGTGGPQLGGTCALLRPGAPCGPPTDACDVGGVCSYPGMCGVDGECSCIPVPDEIPTDPGASVYYACLDDTECCSGRCLGGLCRCLPAGVVPPGPTHLHCCSGLLDAEDRCAPGSNAACVADTDCVSGRCLPHGLCDYSARGERCTTRSDCSVGEVGEEGFAIDCIGGVCTCTPQCAGRECGDDFCGGTCGTCDAAGGEECIGGGYCRVCGCDGRECGFDACGRSCGSCPSGEYCADGDCLACTCDGRECGWPGGGCPYCGGCPAGDSCVRGECWTPACRGTGAACTDASQCCSSSCRAGLCAAGGGSGGTCTDLTSCVTSRQARPTGAGSCPGEIDAWLRNGCTETVTCTACVEDGALDRSSCGSWDIGVGREVGGEAGGMYSCFRSPAATWVYRCSRASDPPTCHAI